MLRYLIVLVVLLGQYVYCQVNENDIIGKWEFEKLTYFKDNNEEDKEATQHYSNLIKGEKIQYNADHSFEPTGSKTAKWKLVEDTLCLKYFENGSWNKKQVLFVDNNTLKTKGKGYMKSGGYIVYEYKKVLPVLEDSIKPTDSRFVGKWKVQSVVYKDEKGSVDDTTSKNVYDLMKTKTLVYKEDGSFYNEGFESFTGKWYVLGEYLCEKGAFQKEYDKTQFRFPYKDLFILFGKQDGQKFEVVMEKVD
jgi:hypothetical protein